MLSFDLLLYTEQNQEASLGSMFIRWFLLDTGLPVIFLEQLLFPETFLSEEAFSVSLKRFLCRPTT